MNFKLLIVEDEDIIRRGLVYSVDWEAQGCSEVLQAADGQEAVEQIRLHRPDIVIMDINIPFLSGLEVLEQTCGDQEYCAIILSGYAEFEYARRALQVGAARFLLKPVDFDELKEAVEAAKQICRQRRAYHEVRKAEDDLKSIDLFSGVDTSMARSDVIRRILAEVEDRYSEKLTIRELAAQFHYSETFLIHKFKDEMKVGFSSYLTRYRIQKAITMLHSGESRIPYIAEACGFPNSKYFNSVFRKHVGCLPKEYLTLSGQTDAVSKKLH